MQQKKSCNLSILVSISTIVQDHDWRKIRRTIEKPEKILKLLNKHLKLGTENAMNFHEFLLSLNLSYNEYVLAFKSDIKEGQAKVFFAKENIRNKSK